MDINLNLWLLKGLGFKSYFDNEYILDLGGLPHEDRKHDSVFYLLTVDNRNKRFLSCDNKEIWTLQDMYEDIKDKRSKSEVLLFIKLLKLKGLSITEKGLSITEHA